MVKTAWRCSQCGAINEAGARACHECGKWPSLFDLQDSVVEDAAVEEQEEFGVEPFEPDVFEAQTFEPETFGGEDPAKPARRFPSRLITVAIVVIWILWYLAGTYLLPD